MKIVLDGERPQSLNKIYSGVHWTKRKAEADRVHTLVRAALPLVYKPFDVPVRIVVTAYFKNRPLDASNIFAKVYEDGLVGHLLVDDSPQYVTEIATRSRVDRKNPRVEIEIIPDGD